MITLVKSSNWEVKRIEKIKALKFNRKYHFIKSIPLVCWCYGLFYNNTLKAVVIFSPPSSPSIINIFENTVERNELIQLSRLILPPTSLKNEGSFLISRAVKLLRKDQSSVKCLITYCDIEKGHVGTVFKASNWIEYGYSTKGGSQGYKKGKSFIHSRSIEASAAKKLKPIKRTIKMRYVYFYPDFASFREVLKFENAG